MVFMLDGFGRTAAGASRDLGLEALKPGTPWATWDSIVSCSRNKVLEMDIDDADCSELNYVPPRIHMLNP